MTETNDILFTGESRCGYSPEQIKILRKQQNQGRKEIEETWFNEQKTKEKVKETLEKPDKYYEFLGG